MPITRLRGSPRLLSVRYAMVSIGLETIMKIQLGEYSNALLATALTIPAFTPIRSSRVMPGLRGIPDVITTTSESAV